MLPWGFVPYRTCSCIASGRHNGLADLGILCSGSATTTVYPSNTAKECAFILGDSQSRVVFAEDQTQVAKLLECREQLPDVMQVVVFDGPGGHDSWVITLDELVQMGREHDAQNPELYDRVANTTEGLYVDSVVLYHGC